MRLTLLLLLAACTGPDRPQRPDFLDADTVNVKVTSIQVLPDAQVGRRLDDLRAVGTTDAEPRVRDQVVLRLLKWGDDAAVPVLGEIYRGDPHNEVARAALGALRSLCAARHGVLQPTTPPPGPITDDCGPVYDGSSRLPPLRPTPRLPAAEFWAAEGVPTRTLSNGEIWPEREEDRASVFTKYADPELAGARKRWP